ncbi:acyl-coA desaturase [Schizosaccharomyces japonicus yFS275]|uniref:Acyl-CoA desaturase n=1 Tax=Schizosaccharomyces japonicus (strain yFS275 / FY16936) TaxID=402676 RepID=B6K5G8_SCHJY|nr:acyl-coA desaturase [Schizosaccharomyces japonicus yFS275]EEB08772.1 acyl-coA desaturase [Schizosaccharomyces japonicus yFS275]
MTPQATTTSSQPTAQSASKRAERQKVGGVIPVVPSVPQRRVDPNAPKHIIDQPWTLTNWYKHLNWLHVPLLFGLPLIALYGILTTPLNAKTAIFAFLYYFYSGLGITAGYHRLWSHRCYKASQPLQRFLEFGGAAAFEGSIRWWSRDHRAHHRYTDTDRDPYSVKKGFWYAHMGWMIIKQNPQRIGRADISDLNADPLVMHNHRSFLKIALFAAFIFPTLVCGLLWNDWRGGFFYAGVCRLVFVHHATFCVNSLAHLIGDQPFDDTNSARDHVLTALVTLGEGYHNFHHAFPNDYRNALKWYQYDPTKVFIWLCSLVGLSSQLKTFPKNEIQKGLVQQKQKQLDKWRTRLNWGVPLDQLPVMEFEEFLEQSKTRPLVLIAGVVHDMTGFDHPGGQALLRSSYGKDATAAFNGGVYDHTNGAHNLLANYRVAVVRGGMEVEVWKSGAGKQIPMKDTAGNGIVRSGQQITRTAVPVEAAAAN